MPPTNVDTEYPFGCGLDAKSDNQVAAQNGGSRAVAMIFPSLSVMVLTGVAPWPAFRPVRCDWTAGSHRPPLAGAIAPH